MPSASTSCTSSHESALSVLAARISIPDLERLARRHGQSEHVTAQSLPLRGAYNLVYPLTFDDGRKWVARIPDPDSFDAPLMRSTIITLRLIREKTTIPFPTIHAYDTSPNNEIGTPYMLMDFVDGVPLIKIWKDGNIVDDAARRYIFEQIAGHMSQLRVLEFDKIGHLQFDEASGIYSVGPLRSEDRTLYTSVAITESGPFTTTHAFFSHRVQRLIESPERYPPMFCAMRLFALALPDPQYDGAPFVLSHPDFDSQNVLVDPKTFTITGFIDWDGVSVGPRLGGFARYPSWITRDWDPFAYAWSYPNSEAENTDDESDDVKKGRESDDQNDALKGKQESDNQNDDLKDKWESDDQNNNLKDNRDDQNDNHVKGLQDDQDNDEKDEQKLCAITSRSAHSDVSAFIEESPETLQRHRELYHSIYATIDPENADITRQSHIFEAIDIALHSPSIAGGIQSKLSEYVFNADTGFRGQITLGIEAGAWMKELKSKASI